MITVFMGRELWKSQRNYSRIKKSFVASSKKLEFTELENGRLAAKVDVLQLKHTELKKIFPQILLEIQNLKIKSKRIEYFSETVIHHQKDIVEKLSDSLLSDSNTVKAFDYKDEFYSVKGEIQSDSIRLNINSIDSIIQVVHRVKRKRPWLWFFSTRPLIQTIYSKNPNSQIQYSKVIKVEN